MAARFERDAIPLLDQLPRRTEDDRSQADAEDLVQDTMLKAYRHSVVREGRTSRRGFRIMSNTWIDAYHGRRPARWSVCTARSPIGS